MVILVPFGLAINLSDSDGSAFASMILLKVSDSYGSVVALMILLKVIRGGTWIFDFALAFGSKWVVELEYELALESRWKHWSAKQILLDQIYIETFVINWIFDG